MIPYTPSNWFWIVAGDDTRAWSSSAKAFVATFPADKTTRIASEAELRDVLDGAGFLELAPGYVPKSVTNFQARAALIQAGLFASIDAAVKGSGDTTMLQAWEYANIYSRDSTFIRQMGAALGLDSQQIDDLFVAAAQVV